MRTGEVPENMPQPKNIYLEQIAVLKPILKLKTKSPEQTAEPTNSVRSSENKVASDDLRIKQKNKSEVVDLTQSPSCSNVKRISNKGKTTSYNSETDVNNKVKVKAGSMLEKMEKAAPYNIFFTTIIKAPQTTQQPNAITFTGNNTIRFLSSL